MSTATSAGSLWDDPAVIAAATQSGFVKFDVVGDTVSGRIISLGKHVWPDGDVAIKVEFAGEEVPTLTASQVLLKSALFQLKPNVGDDLTVTLVDIETASSRTLKKFRVDVRRIDGSIETVDQSELPASF